MRRREAIRAMLGSPLILAAGCSPPRNLPAAGTIVGADRERGHVIRDQRVLAVDDAQCEVVDTLIVGGGVAGLAAAWRLQRLGQSDFLLVELEDEPGGTSRGGTSAVTRYPWGAHYLPAPMSDNHELVNLLEEMGMIEGRDAQGRPQYREELFCRDPEERLFIGGRWREDLFPDDARSEDREEWQRFRDELNRWVNWRDVRGRRAFAIPAAAGSDDDEVRELDRISFAEWLERRGFGSRLVQWEVDYACRDDYGATPDQVSAWAGLFYFASRVSTAGSSSQPLLTWPEGNARLSEYLAQVAGDRVLTRVAIQSVEPGSRTKVIGLDARSGFTRGWLARHVIYAAPHFTAPYVISGYSAVRGEFVSQFVYGTWLVANLHLRGRPSETSFPLAWDNVIYDSPGLGYVVATHQQGRDFGPTVFTYYRPVIDADPRQARAWLQRRSWEECAELVLADLETAHPDIRQLVERLDVMLWGHAMIRPRVGFRFSESRRQCSQPFGSIHFAHSDLSGLALFEEAFYHGVRAAEETYGHERGSR